MSLKLQLLIHPNMTTNAVPLQTPPVDSEGQLAHLVLPGPSLYCSSSYRLLFGGCSFSQCIVIPYS